MLTYEQILELIDKLVETPLAEINLTQGEFTISLKKASPNNSPNNNLSNINTSTLSALPQLPVNENNNPEIKLSEPKAANKLLENLIDITSPMVGTFYASASPDSPPFVAIGQSVKVGDPLCIIEAMKMMNELPSEINGTIAEICVNNADIVEYGQVLFKVKPA